MKKRCTIFAALLFIIGCGVDEPAVDPGFSTSGNPEADQRAAQRIAKTEQLRGEGIGSGDDKNIKRPLFARLGGEVGVKAIVNDFVDRAMADPRVNWKRTGVTKGGLLGIGDTSAEWSATPVNIARMKIHIEQFISVATGGPAKYEGRDMKEVHTGMKVSNDQFNAVIGDLKQSLDLLRVPIPEQKELLEIMESTRTQIVEEK